MWGVFFLLFSIIHAAWKCESQVQESAGPVWAKTLQGYDWRSSWCRVVGKTAKRKF